MNFRKALTIVSFILIFTLLISGTALVAQYNSADNYNPRISKTPMSTNDPTVVNNQSFNVLIVIQEDSLADDIFILNCNKVNNTYNLLSIPGNLKTSQGKMLNSVMASGDTMDIVHNIKVKLDINIKYFFKFDYTAFAAIVDELDGISFTLPYDFTSSTTNLSKFDTYTGEKAVELFMYKGPHDNKYTQSMLDELDGSTYDNEQRYKYHLEFIFTLLRDKGNHTYISKFNDIIAACGKRIHTNISTKDVESITENSQSINLKNLKRYSLTGTEDENGFFIFDTHTSTDNVKSYDSMGRVYKLSDLIRSEFYSES